MILIRIDYSIKPHSLNIEFDIDGAKDLIKAFEYALNNESGNNKIVVKMYDIKFNKSPYELSLYAKNNEESDSITIDDSSMIFETDIDTLEYGISKLKECENGLDFNPAEFGEFDVKIKNKNYKDMYTYCKLIK